MRRKNARSRMNSRRDFLKTAATGAVVLGAQSKLGLAAMLDKKAEGAKSKVVVARDAALHGSDGRLDEKRVQALLDRAIAAYTGREKPVEAWKRIVPVGQGDRPQGERPGRQGNLDPRGAGDGHLRAAATGRREARQHYCLGPQRARPRGMRPDHQYRREPHSLLTAPTLPASRRSRNSGARRGSNSPRSLPASAPW